MVLRKERGFGGFNDSKKRYFLSQRDALFSHRCCYSMMPNKYKKPSLHLTVCNSIPTVDPPSETTNYGGSNQEASQTRTKRRKCWHLLSLNGKALLRS
ncbi:hypothetical protein JOB18_016565 [Solea senegalensis]|uniref:Uncharacterized protein n=1 Tax=Solea senegalensis TaxID=28829 RepID=A0AAV6QTB7_SOLSE|nr:hypothetical protein JOB18_016565 [Solea senegalensis]